MTNAIRLLIVAGARPNSMKVAPLVHEIRMRSAGACQPALEYCLVHTGQRYDEKMSAVFFDDLGISQKARSSTILQRLGLQEKAFSYVTLHRAANVDHAPELSSVMKALGRIAADIPVVFAMHPRTTQRCQQFGIPLQRYQGLNIVEPLSYHDSLRLTKSAAFVLTDSGGLQEESTYFRTPCLTLRPNTERPVTVRSAAIDSPAWKGCQPMWSAH